MAKALQDALSRALERTGKTREDFAQQSSTGRLFKRLGVDRSPEIDRVRRLPARIWQEDPDLEAMRMAMTEWLRTPSGSQILRPVQAKALEELHDWGGTLLPVRVGGGKTLIGYLGGTVAGALRPLQLVPAKLRGKTVREFAELRRHWSALEPAVLSYEEISRDGGWDKLCAINPDLILADEAHRLKNRQAGVTRKLMRWHSEHPETRLCAMSGTITSRSLREYGHLAKWALGKLCPLPIQGNILADWADALDEKVPELRRLAPGALLAFCNDEELDALAKDQSRGTEIARKAYRRRLVSTPGVVATEETALGVSLQITVHKPVLGKMTWSAFDKLRSDWEMPDGHPFTDASDLWRHARELACGFYYRWDPPAPPEWMAARRDWARFVREALSRRLKGVDTELQVAKACDAGRLPSKELQAWRDIRDTFKPNSVPVWIDDTLIKWIGKRLREQNRPTIVWTEHVAFGKRLAEKLSLPYFGRDGLDKDGQAIEDAAGRCDVVASIQSNFEGRNLHTACSSNLVASAPPNGLIWEQMLGRTHREGQDADEVLCDVVIACVEQWEGMIQAQADARYVEQTTGQPHKLLYADWEGMPTEADAVALSRSGDPMWRK